MPTLRREIHHFSQRERADRVFENDSRFCYVNIPMESHPKY